MLQLTRLREGPPKFNLRGLGRGGGSSLEVDFVRGRLRNILLPYQCHSNRDILEPRITGFAGCA